MLDLDEVEEAFEAAALDLTCVPPTTVTQGHEAGQLGVKFVPLRFNEPTKKCFVRIICHENRNACVRNELKHTFIIQTIPRYPRHTCVPSRVQHSDTHQS